MAVDPQRHAAILAALGDTGLDALVSLSPTEVLLVTGYWPVMGSSLAVFTRGGEVLAIVPEDELELAQATSNAQFIVYKPHSLDTLTPATEALVEPLKELARRIPTAASEVGLSLDEGMQTASYQAMNRFRDSALPLLRRAFPGVTPVPADGIFNQLKALKTAVEIDRIRRACKLAGIAFGEASRAIVAGRREDEVAAELNAVFARVANDGFERGSGFFFCMSGPNSAKASGAYARTRRRVLEDGDLVMIHANTTGDGYWTDITRTYVVGEFSEKQSRMRAAIEEARAAALDAIKPGAVASEVDAAARGVLKRHGFEHEFKHATGHGVGFAAANPDALPRIHPQSPDILEAGMTFNVEPAIYFDGVGGMRHCDVVACRDSGVEVLTKF